MVTFQIWTSCLGLRSDLAEEEYVQETQRQRTCHWQSHRWKCLWWATIFSGACEPAILQFDEGEVASKDSKQCVYIFSYHGVSLRLALIHSLHTGHHSSLRFKPSIRPNYHPSSKEPLTPMPRQAWALSQWSHGWLRSSACQTLNKDHQKPSFTWFHS